MSRRTLPLVSVIIPTYNRNRLFYRALNSILKQTYENVEIVIVDDNSTLPPDLEQFTTKFPIRYHKNNNNLGGAKSRNIGFDLSNGEYICFLDDDDTYVEKKIELLIKELQNDNSLDAVFGKIIKKSEPNRNINFKSLDKNDIIKSLETIKYLHTNTSLIKSEVFNWIRFDEALDKFQDTQLHIELVNNFKCKYINEPVAYWNDNHGLNQITDMKTKANYIRHIINFKKLQDNLYKRKSISYKYYLHMYSRYIRMANHFKNKFGDIADIRIKPYEIYIARMINYITLRIKLPTKKENTASSREQKAKPLSNKVDL